MAYDALCSGKWPPSVGFVEVYGLSAALVVADVMAKAGHVRIAGIEANAAGGMGIKVTGRTGDVHSAVHAGEATARQMNALAAASEWSHYTQEADFLIHCRQEYNALLETNEHLLPPDAGPRSKGTPQGARAAMPSHEAIGLIETQGLIGLIEAADAMCKAASVRIIGKEKIGAAYVTVIVEGDVAAVKAAVQAGTEAVQRVGGKLILSHVIARPHEELAALLPPRP